jgi:large repetitive protein
VFASRRGAAALLAAMLLVAWAGAPAGAAGDLPVANGTVTSEGDASAAPGPLPVTATADGEPAGAVPGPSVAVGATVAWAYEVGNAGPGSVWALYLWHDGVGAADCPDRSLAPGETVRCTATAAAEAGAHAAAVRAWAWDAAGAQAAGEGVAYYTGLAPVAVPAPAIDLEAFVGGQDADAPPGPVITPGSATTFRYRVRNTGNVTLWGLWVRDQARGAIACPTRALAPGEQVVCAVRRPAEEGAHSSSAEAGAADAAGTEVVDRDLLHYLGAAPVPGIEMEALVEGFDGDVAPGPRVGVPGEAIVFTYLVTNTGGLPLTRVRVTDEALGAVACPSRTLAPGASMACTASTVAQLGEFASGGRVTARAAATPVGDSDPVYYHVRSEPRIHNLAVEVRVNGRQADHPTGPNLVVGSSAHFVYIITYTGNSIVYNVMIQDPFVPEALLSCNGDRTLTAGETLRCTAAVPVAAGQYASLVTAVSWDADGRRVAAEDRVHYYGMA